MKNFLATILKVFYALKFQYEAFKFSNFNLGDDFIV
jgi:hypothetical protein